MNINNTNSWLSLIANVGVLVGIIFLAYEIQQNRKATEADVYQNRTELRSNGDMDVVLNSPNFHNILFEFEKSVSNLGAERAVADLDDENRWLITRYHRSVMVRFDNVVFQHSNGFVLDSNYENVLNGIRNFLPTWYALVGSNNILVQELENASREE